VNWALQSLVCDSADGTSTTSISGPEAQITLAAGDTVHCTYTDAPQLATMLTVRKISFNGVGTFPFSISSTSGTVNVAATTTEPGVAADSTPTNITSPGTYTITEEEPAVTGGTWRLVSAQCSGVDEPVTRNAITVTASLGSEPVCTFVNTFVPDGSITVYKVMQGGLGTSEFLITKLTDADLQLRQSATPPATDVATRATGDASTKLTLGRYSVEELEPAGGKPIDWSLVDLTCHGVHFHVAGPLVTFTLTTRSPSATCTYTDRYSTTTIPVAPPSPVAPGPPVHVTG
jgi:hypothetical protein